MAALYADLIVQFIERFAFGAFSPEHAFYADTAFGASLHVEGDALATIRAFLGLAFLTRASPAQCTFKKIKQSHMNHGGWIKGINVSGEIALYLESAVFSSHKGISSNSHSIS